MPLMQSIPVMVVSVIQSILIFVLTNPQDRELETGRNFEIHASCSSDSGPFIATALRVASVAAANAPIVAASHDQATGTGSLGMESPRVAGSILLFALVSLVATAAVVSVRIVLRQSPDEELEEASGTRVLRALDRAFSVRKTQALQTRFR
jgi:hypothetical protein